MKVVFAHDHQFLYYSEKYYSNGSLGLRALERYTKVFGKLTVLSRQKEAEKADNKYTLSSGKNIKFIKISNLYSASNIFNYKQSTQIIEEEIKDADYVIARLPSGIGSLAIKYAKKNKKPYLIELVGCPWDSLWNHSFKGKLLAPYRYMTTKKMVNEATHVLYVTNEFLQKRYPTKGKSVNSSNVILDDFNEETLEKRLKKISLSEENKKVIIGTTAALNVRYKGQQYVIEALGKLKKQGIASIEYQLVGSGNPDYLLSIAKKYDVVKQIKILGSKPNAEVFKWLDMIDIYVQPSKTEGLPRALIEAMSSGLPAFGAKAGGIPELLESRFIYINDKKKVENIVEILLSFDNKTMKEQAKRNYEESQKYKRNIIEKRRTLFMEKFRNLYI